MRVIAAFLVNTLCNVAIGLLVARFLGPEEFGRFALALSVGLALQTTLFEWIRQSAIRFYSARSRLEEPGLRATLDVSFAILAAISTAVVAGAILVGVEIHAPFNYGAIADGYVKDQDEQADDARDLLHHGHRGGGRGKTGET